MVSSSIFIDLLGLVACGVAQQQQQQPECASEFQDFHTCMRTNSKPPSSMPDFAAVKSEMDGCFTTAGCTPPSGPGGFGGPGGPGGRAGPPPSSAGNNPFQCFQAVHAKVGDQMTKCLQDKGVTAPSFGPGGGPGPGGPPPGFGGPGGPGGPGGFGGPPPGGPGGPFGGGPPPGPGGPGGPFGGGPPIEVLASLCNNDQDKAKQLQSCMQNVMDKHKPTRDQVKEQYDSMCSAEKTCKPKLGSCEDKMRKTGQAMCECHEQIRPKAEAAMQAEDSCKNMKPPPSPTGDCSKPQSPCEEGFDKFYDRVSKGGFPPFGGPPPQ